MMIKSSIGLSLVLATHGLQLQPSDSTTFEYTTADGQTLNFVTENKHLYNTDGVFHKGEKRRRAPNGKSLVLANPWQDECPKSAWPFCNDDEFETEYKATNPGIGASLDHLLRDQFLQPEIIKKAAAMLVGTIVTLTLLGKMFAHPNENAIDQLYFGMALAPMVLILRVISKLRVKLDIFPEKVFNKDDPQKSTPSLDELYKTFHDDLYDPHGTIFGKVVDTWSVLGGTHGSVSEFLTRTPVIAWCFLFMIINSFVAEMIRAFYTPDNNVLKLPEIGYHKLWILFSIVKNIGWLAVILTTHFYGNQHGTATLFAMGSAIMQVWCIANTHPDQFWRPYYLTAIGVSFAFVAFSVFKGFFPSWRYPNNKVKQNAVHLFRVLGWPFEWATAIIVYILLFNEMTEFAVRDLYSKQTLF